MSVIERVREQYPTLAFLLNDREVGPLLRDAVDPNKGFSAQTFQWKLMNTNWYKQRSVAHRQYTIRGQTDPGEQFRMVRDLTSRIGQRGKALGANLTYNQRYYIAHSMLRQGIDDPNHPLILNGMVRLARKQGGVGFIRTTANGLRAAWQNDFFQPLSNKHAMGLASAVARGEKTEQDWYEAGRAFAINAYPHLKRQLQSGQTMNEMFGPHMQAIEQTLELNPGSIKPWGNSKWAAVWKGITDSKTGKVRSLSVAEAERMARSDKRFWKTEQGRAEDAGAASMMLNIFGARK